METTKIKRDDLIETIKQNREKHKKDFNDALKEWKKKATKALKKAAKKAEEEGWITENPLSDLPKPQNFLKSYDQVIRRLEFEVEDTVQVDEREFAAWVLDEWSWRGAFIATSSMYNDRI